MNTYQAGLISEAEIIQKYGWRPSLPQENIKLDIDAWARHSTATQRLLGRAVSAADISISIKTQHTALRTGNISLESKVLWVPRYDPQIDSFESVHRLGVWRRSWLFTGKADLYLFRVGSEDLLVSSSKLKAALRGGSVPYRITTNRRETMLSQFELGHRHLDARNVLVKVQDLKQIIEA